MMEAMLWLNIVLGLALAAAARHEYRRRNYGHARLLGTTAVLAASATAVSMAWSG